MALSQFAIDRAKPKEKPYLLSDGDGLHLRIHPNGGIEKISMSSFAVSVLATLALATLEFLAVVWYVAYWDLFPKYSPQRILAWIVFVCSTVIIPISQIKLYQRLNGIESDDGRYLYVLIFTESAISVVLIFSILIKRRRP